MALVQGGVRIIMITGDGDGAGYRATEQDMVITSYLMGF